MLGESLTLWTIRLALSCYFVGLGGIIVGRHNLQGQNRARVFWSAGCVFFVGHLIAAFHFYHAWSHDSAVLETARQSAEVVGVEAGYGIYMNYLFALLWMVDVGWWWFKGHAGYLGRAKAISVSIHGYLLFIVINGALVFVGGPVRWFSAVAILILTALWLRSRVNLTTRVGAAG